MEAAIMSQEDPTSRIPRPRLADQLRDALRRLHYSYRTEKTYAHWTKRFILYHNKRHPWKWANGKCLRFSPIWR